jgi:hypothetical protein
MASNVAARDNYLTLALLSRRIIEALKDLVIRNERDRLNTALPAAIESLQAATNSRYLSGYGLRVARSYDQVRTINELFTKDARTEMIAVLNALLENKSPNANEEALKAIEFFRTLESRALQNYRHPAPRARVQATT